MKKLICIMLFLAGTQTAAAQKIVRETEDAFTRSQALRAEAIAAFRAGDTMVAFDGIKKALQHRPTSSALLYNAIFLAAETDNLEAAIQYGHAYAKLGIAPGAAVQAKLKEKLPAADWQALEQQFTTNSKSAGAASHLITVPANHRLIEGIAVDEQGTFFLSTVVSATILQVTPSGTISVLFDGNAHNLGSFFGIAYERTSNSLYATFARVDQTASNASDTDATGIVRINPLTGELMDKWVLPGGTQGQQIADIAIGGNGAIYAADAQAGKIYRLDSDGLKAVPTTVQFMSAQGLVAHDNNTLLVADYGRGLWRIDATTGNAALYGVPDTVALAGIDGLLRHNDRIIAIQNGTSPHRIIEVHLDDATLSVTHITILAQNLAQFDEPTLGTSSKDGIAFVASSQWPKFDKQGTVREGATINPTQILLIPDENKN